SGYEYPPKPAQLQIWDVAKRTAITTLHGSVGYGSQATRRVALSGDGKRLATHDFDPQGVAHPDGRIKVWDAATGKEIKRLANYSCQALSLNQDGSRLAAYAGNGFTVWELPSGKELFSRSENTYYSGGETGFALSPDSKRLAVFAYQGLQT